MFNFLIFRLDCSGFICDEEMKFKEKCTIYSKGPYDKYCSIPCLLDNCTSEIRYDDFTCIVFKCIPKWDPIGPTPAPPSPKSNALSLGIGLGLTGN